MIRLGPHWHNSKITWANIVNGSTGQLLVLIHNKVTILNRAVQ